MGASPETLLSKHGIHIETEALAGSIAAGRDPAMQAETLQQSKKELTEHHFVREDIVGKLIPLCGSIRAPDKPQIKSLKHLLHLHTPIQAQLRHPTHVLDLMERLHPTPAVGGTPVEAALKLIAKYESISRGFYAGPIGWFTPQGDGCFAVALRSALLDAQSAWVYAGAGIVAESDARQEYKETELKQQTMLQIMQQS